MATKRPIPPAEEWKEEWERTISGYEDDGSLEQNQRQKKLFKIAEKALEKQQIELGKMYTEISKNCQDTATKAERLSVLNSLKDFILEQGGYLRKQ